MTHFQDVTPDPRKGPDDDEEDREQRSQGQHRSRSLWSRVGGRSSSRSREPVGSERQVYTQDSRGRQWARAPSEGRSRSYRSRSPSEGQVLDMLEKHLDPMLHEATIQHSMYSPVFIPSSAQEIVVGAATEMPPGARNLNELVAGLSTPVQAAHLPTPDVSSRRPCRNKHFKKPLSPASMKMITTLVEKGGCKGARLKTAKKKAVVVPV
ncbi:uncharacterized protein [Oryza sativa Japonica Group]|uniref:uncharacterized protein n=1 Tax=Oryza sativa subsp. japonica TaxID=39947 RepID=UPI00339C5BA1